MNLSNMTHEQMLAAIESDMQEHPGARVLADVAADGTLGASTHAPDNKHLLGDDYVRKAVEFAVEELSVEARFDDEPLLVSSASCDMSRYYFDGPRRTTYELSSGALSRDGGYCDRCQLPAAQMHIFFPHIQSQAVMHFRIARSHIVVDFATCADCWSHLQVTYGPITQAGASDGSV